MVERLQPKDGTQDTPEDDHLRDQLMVPTDRGE
jgi:hypothetical protein